jgi:TPP-dependent pyruvate/acetoin dehydrogenase alpha subunit
LEKCRAEAKATVKKAVEFADASPPPPAGLAKVGREAGREGERSAKCMFFILPFGGCLV